MGRGCVRNLRPHLESPVETTVVPHGGDPQDRAASPRPRCIAANLPSYRKTDLKPGK
ncbi:hypothetical protein [Moorena producens]|uniref:hypothetical protein n=1 Tax=Moorena producens TaxID=1155739 RepID=UPI003C745E57